MLAAKAIRIIQAAILAATVAGCGAKREVPKADAWPPDLREITITSTADVTAQPAMWRKADDSTGPRPLLVGLHTWSADYTQVRYGATYADWCVRQGWHFIYPNFRGPNHTPQSMGSRQAVQDVVDAVAYAKTNARVDTDRIYLVGVSGGAHMALLMAGKHPEIWAGVSAWCGISDIGAWHGENVKEGKPGEFALDIRNALTRTPEPGDEEAWKRSPLSCLGSATSVPLDINHGVHDGHDGSVPFTHSLHAFNAAVPQGDRLSSEDIGAFYRIQKTPATWPPPEADSLYGKQSVQFRKVASNTRVTIFEGGHEILFLPALNWLAHQRKGKGAVWKIERVGEVAREK